MATGFRVQGAPSTIQSNVVGAGLIEGDQLGDQLPGVLQSLQETPEASKTSTLYYNEKVGSFNQPSFQRSFGAFNLSIPINRFGDSGSIEVNPDIYWKGPAIVTTSFTIPYAYHGPQAARRGENQDAQTILPITNSSSDSYSFRDWALPITTVPSYAMTAGSCTVRPRMFYSWGAAYANMRQIRMNMGGAMSYVLDHYANFVGVMASCVSMCQRAALMKAAGSGVMIPDYEGESRLGIAHDCTETGSIPLYSADGGGLNSSVARTCAENYGHGATLQTGPSAIPGPAIEHWTMVIKTPHTNFGSMHQMRRPVDTRLFSSNFVIDFFSSSALDTFIDTGLGYQPLCPVAPTATDDYMLSGLKGLILETARSAKMWKREDGLFPSCLYRQLYIPNASAVYSTGSILSDKVNLTMINCDITVSAGGDAGSSWSNYRDAQVTYWSHILRSKGYAATYGADPLTSTATAYLNPDNFPLPQYTSIISASRLANDQLGAKKILETRPDLCVYYPFQHFTSQAYRVTQVTDASGSTPYNPNVSYQPSQLTAFTSTVAGGSGYGGLTELYCKTFGAAPSSYQNPLFCALSIPNNPLTCLYVMVMREKDRQSLGYSTPNQYSPVLYWNALELQAFNLSYSAQTLHRYNTYDEYLCTQLHERVEPLIVPFRGGPVCRRDLPLNNPRLIQDHPGYPGTWYNSYIYELCLVDQLPLRNEAFFQQTPGFRGEMLNFNFWIRPTLRPWCATDYDFRSVTAIPSDYTPGTFDAKYAEYVDRIAGWCPGIPQVAVGVNPGTIWNLNNDNLMIVCVFAQNALWQLNPLHCKTVFARGA